MKVVQQASLGQLTTFAVPASAQLLLTLESEEDLLSVPALDPAKDLVLGGGSNVLFETDVPGTVFLNRIKGRQIIEDHDDQAIVEVGAGENWHQLVLWSLNNGLSGLENLSLIPGLAGAAPIQNIGAYGVELSSVLDSVTAWDWQKARWSVINLQDCGLNYRNSRFKSSEPGRYLITSLRLRLQRQFKPQLAYGGLQDMLRSMDISEPSPAHISTAVIRLREKKLPDPRIVGNVGSFFKNPILAMNEAEQIQHRFSALPGWPSAPGQTKLSAAWMIEHCGLKGHREGDAGVSALHALVLVNYGSATGREIAGLAKKVQTMVFEEFGTWLEQEPVTVSF
jgi:UDP-N-acetylmuramate dehydrogenase